jgi:hypothetical protein
MRASADVENDQQLEANPSRPATILQDGEWWWLQSTRGVSTRASGKSEPFFVERGFVYKLLSPLIFLVMFDHLSYSFFKKKVIIYFVISLRKIEA